MTINNTTQVNYTRVNTQMQQVSDLSQQASAPSDRATFSEAAKQLAQENVHSQSGASGTWAQPTTSAQNSESNKQTSTNDLQSLLLKNILSAYGTSGSQNSTSNLSFTA